MHGVLAVATMLGGEGPTGVETHFKAVLAHAKHRGIRTRLVTPYTGPRWMRVIFRPLKNQKRELAQVAYRTAQARLIEAELKQVRRETNEPVTVYAQCPLSARAALRAAAGDANWRVVLVVHYNRAESDEVVQKGIARAGGVWTRHLDGVERAILPKVSQLIFVSDYMRRIVTARVPEIVHVPQQTLMNFAAVSPGRRLDVVGAVGDLIAIGTLEPRKNQAFVLRVLAAARQRGAVYSLSLVGDGPDRASLERIAGELGVRDQVHFVGFQHNAAGLIPQHRVLVHAAQMENCPITLIEGLSYGRPILAGAVGGIPEIFSDGVEGFHWDLNDPIRAADRVTDLLGDAAKYSAAAAAAQRRYDTAFAPLPERWVNLLMPPTAQAA